MERDKQEMGVVSIIMGCTAITVTVMLMWGMTLKLLWTWFMVPNLNLTEISFVQATGLSSVSLFTLVREILNKAVKRDETRLVITPLHNPPNELRPLFYVEDEGLKSLEVSIRNTAHGNRTDSDWWTVETIFLHVLTPLMIVLIGWVLHLFM